MKLITGSLVNEKCMKYLKLLNKSPMICIFNYCKNLQVLNKQQLSLYKSIYKKVLYVNKACITYCRTTEVPYTTILLVFSSRKPPTSLR